MSDLQGICATTLPAGRGWRPSKFIPHEGGKVTPLGDDVYLDREYAREAAARMISQQRHHDDSRHDAILLSAGVIMLGTIIILAIVALIVFQDIAPLFLVASILTALAVKIIILKMISSRIMRKVRVAAAKTSEFLLSQPDPIGDAFINTSGKTRFPIRPTNK